MQLSPSWKPNSFSATQTVTTIFKIPKVHYRVQKSPPLFPNLSLMNPIHTPILFL